MFLKEVESSLLLKRWQMYGIYKKMLKHPKNNFSKTAVTVYGPIIIDPLNDAFLMIGKYAN